MAAESRCHLADISKPPKYFWATVSLDGRLFQMAAAMHWSLVKLCQWKTESWGHFTEDGRLAFCCWSRLITHYTSVKEGNCPRLKTPPDFKLEHGTCTGPSPVWNSTCFLSIYLWGSLKQNKSEHIRRKKGMDIQGLMCSNSGFADVICSNPAQCCPTGEVGLLLLLTGFCLNRILDGCVAFVAVVDFNHGSVDL